ncbi:MAG TPA: hypothetical protein VGG49_12385 [Steroidobacteraceae bacterium]
MPLTVKPKLVVSQLSGPGAVGQFVNVAGKFGIVCVAPQDPQKRLGLVIFDQTAKRFAHQLYSGETALIFSGERVFEPDLSAPTSMIDPGPGSGAMAFVAPDGIYVVLRTIDGSDWRLLNLETGNLVQWNQTAMHAFRNWRLSVADAGGHTVQVFKA